MAEPVELGFVTLGAALVAAIAPGIVAYVTSMIHSREKREDWARQDAVAAQAAKAAKLLLDAQAATFRQTMETQEHLHDLRRGQKEIHALVNSNLTAEKQGRLIALKAQLLLMKDNVRLVGDEASPETIKGLKDLEAAIIELAAELAERGQTAIVADGRD